MALTTVQSGLLGSDAQALSFRNRIINGDMRIWQRATTFTNAAPGTYSADRWFTSTNGINLTLTQDTSSPSTAYKYSLKAVPASNVTATECVIRQFIEQQNIFDFAGQTITATAWVNCSKSSVKFRLATQNATGGADVTQTMSVTAGSWTKITYSFSSFSAVTAWTSKPTDTGGFLDIGFLDSTALTTSDYIYITGVQLEKGSVATPFENRPYGMELALCQRYYYKSISRLALGDCSTATAAAFLAFFPVTLRVAPSALETTGVASDYSIAHSGGSTPCSVIPVIASASVTGAQIVATVASGLTVGRGARLVSSTDAYLAWSAEH